MCHPLVCGDLLSVVEFAVTGAAILVADVTILDEREE